MSETGRRELNSDSSSERDRSEDRMHILEMIESGKISVDEGIQQMQGDGLHKPHGDLLNQLEAGEIDVEDVILALEGEGVAGGGGTSDAGSKSPIRAPSAEQLRFWWLLIPATGMVITAFGGWLGTLGGWWWLCAGPALLSGFLFLLFALITQNAPWLHIRINTGQNSWPHRITISLPIPIGLASWGFRKWGKYAGSLDATAVDELLLSLDRNLSMENPIQIEVDEDDDSGERIRVFLG